MITNNWKIFLSLLNLLIAGCSPITNLLPQKQLATEQHETLVMATFQVKLPEPLTAGETVFLSEVDEVTGLAFNPILHPMEAVDNQNLKLILPVKINTFFKYRYIRKGEYSVLEFAPDGRQVRYRVFLASEPGTIQDSIYRWTDSQPIVGQGRIIGKASRTDNNQPIPNLTITAGGLQTLTLSDGSFVLEGLPEGKHTLVAFAQDGSYKVFQQEAIVQAGAATEAVLSLQAAKMVKVTFFLEAPANTPPGTTIRIAGNLSQLGNSFANLRGGINNNAVRLPGMHRTENGLYQATLTLPAGSDIRYKYTLGDGIWNTEYTDSRTIFTRQFFVPEYDVEINDQVASWRDTDQKMISFDVTVPANTPSDEIVAIQFNPGYAWMEPIPMWLIEPNRWVYILYSPLSGLGSLHYRYCRDLQCGSADDISTAGNLATGREVTISNEPQLVVDKVDSWMWLDSELSPAVVPNLEIPQREAGFLAGVAFQDAYHPTWFYRLPKATNDIKEINANWVIMQPSKTYSSSGTPFQDAVPGSDNYGTDFAGFLTYTRSQGLQTAIFPVSHYLKPSDQWWQEAPKDFSWWVSWFDYYTRFTKDYALLATNTGASALILGDPSVSPAFPPGLLKDGSRSNIPEDTEIRWRKIVQEARDNFKGFIWWAVEYSFTNQDENQITLPPFIDAFDGIYVKWSQALASEPGASIESMTQAAGEKLDSALLPVIQSTGKPVILVIQYPSATGATTGCLPGLEGNCLDLAMLDRPNPDVQTISRDLNEQEKAYNAIFAAVNNRAWISGVVSNAYYFPVPLQDKSSSVHGKPARGVLWFWYGKFLGILGP